MVKQQIINEYNTNPNKIKVIYNGIELKKISYSKSFARLSKEFSIKKDQATLIFVGSGFKRKGVREFLKIVSKLKTKDFCFVNSLAFSSIGFHILSNILF